MKTLNLLLGSAWLTTASLLSALPAFAQSKPIALVGSSYGKYEIKAIVKDLLPASGQKGLLYEDLGEEFPVADLDRYRLVIVATAVATPLDAAGFAKLEVWVRDGGHLLLIHQAPNAMAGPEASVKATPFAWAGFSRAAYHRTLVECALLAPDSRVFKGAFEDDAPKKGKKPEWMMRANMLLTTKGGPMENLVGSPMGCLVGFAPIDRGWVAYLGHEWFRLRAAKSDLDGSWRRILLNLVDDTVSAKP
ncbi:MAG: hypothetical protein IT578_07425 [Verrucomicrobiae bacterium]|nr:hypothetical protein [Verrucomicrobiae bacterium]